MDESTFLKARVVTLESLVLTLPDVHPHRDFIIQNFIRTTDGTITHAIYSDLSNEFLEAIQKVRAAYPSGLSGYSGPPASLRADDSSH